MSEFKERNATIHAGKTIPLYTGDERTLITGSWNTKGQIAIEQTYALPMNILAVIGEHQTGDFSG